METRKKIVLIGGGFAGLHLARKLNKENFDIWLLDKQNHHQFQPLYYQVACARLEPSNISFPFRKIFQRSPNVQIRMADVTKIVAEENKVETNIGEYHYDFLVIATGCKTNFFGNAEISKHAFAMKTTEEAIEIKNNILLSFERIISAEKKDREALMNIVLVGGGPTGVELAGAFAEMRNHILPRDYPHIDFSQLKIYLLEGSKNTLNSMSDDSKRVSKKYLTDLGVIVKTETIVTNYDGHLVTLNNGETIPTSNLIWAAGVTGNVIEGLPLENIIKNRYKVDRYNKVMGTQNIYAIGDVAYMETPLYPNGHPQLANVAINQGKNLAKNFLNLIKKRPLKEYEYKDLGSMATIGKRRAVVDLPFVKFQGFFAWFIWMFLHLMLILSVRNKLAIFFNWAWNYLAKDSSLRLILKPRK
ncbi:MAG: FAD-dependent oxidoreductase [Bacteroidota bacterium]|jgi:NADH dehydrogenase|nr:FAD-dependent oxidoreductase [Bacteroidota bacterium]